MRNIGVDALVVVEDPYDIFYLTGVKVSRGVVLLHPEKKVFLVDARYFEGCQENKVVEVVLQSEENEQKILQDLAFSTVFLTGSKLSYDRYKRWEKIFSGKEIKNGDPLRLIRFVKEQQEIVKMKKSAQLNREAMEKIERELYVGVLEEEVAWSFEKYCRERGASQMAFAPHIAFGANTSKPHYKSGKTPLKKGDAVLIDTGVVVDAYVSDRTRSFLFQGENKKYQEIKALVKKAHDAALERVKIGTPLRSVVESADRVFKEKGVSHLFKHNLGHSLGLEVHEYPTLSPTLPEDLLCEEGMVFTIEPGLYLEGEFGVRHENTIVVTKKGAEIL